ncbi:MAG: RluA family pseudouridine synthase [Spirochaetaceae bacterium]|nr:RluA family pseudouridine synthase [Spirochaetaceae bacterium]
MNQSRINTKPEILYEDEYFIIVHKEPEELTVPGRGPDKMNCLMSRTALFYPEVYNIHRLDQPTSGLVVIALSKEMQRSLSILFQDRKIEKEYIALVEGQLSEDSGIIELPLRADIDNRPVQVVDREQGKKAITRWSVVEKLDSCTRVLLKPETGRTHQLRVHQKAMGHPILGDRLYNDKVPDDLMGELKLHAMSLKFEHPVTGELVSVRKEPRF